MSCRTVRASATGWIAFGCFDGWGAGQGETPISAKLAHGKT